MSTDFARAFAQIAGLEPSRTVLHMEGGAEAREPFSAALRDALQQHGYALRTAETLPGDQEVGFSISDTRNSAAKHTLVYEVSVGSVSLRRSYRPTPSGHVRPAAAMLVKGADATAIRLDESLFEDAESPAKADEALPAVPPLPVIEPDMQPLLSEPGNTAAAASPARKAPAEPGPPAAAAPLQPSQSPEAQLARPDVGQEPLAAIAAPTITRSMPAKASRLDDLAQLTRDDKRNVKELGRSNFSTILDDYQLVRESVLVFGDDSLRLGKQNKWILQGLVEKFDPARDVFSVIGCSHGSTNYAGGNAGLAHERAARVVEELVYAGVPKSKVLDEGCWAGEHFTKMPSRGVVVALRRLPS